LFTSYAVSVVSQGVISRKAPAFLPPAWALSALRRHFPTKLLLFYLLQGTFSSQEVISHKAPAILLPAWALSAPRR